MNGRVLEIRLEAMGADVPDDLAGAIDGAGNLGVGPFGGNEVGVFGALRQHDVAEGHVALDVVLLADESVQRQLEVDPIEVTILGQSQPPVVRLVRRGARLRRLVVRDQPGTRALVPARRVG